MDGQHRVVGAQAPAVVDDLLRPALDLRVAALHRVKVQVGRVRARRHRRRGAAAHANAHAGAAELDQQRAGGELDLLRQVRADGAQTARDHDGLVIAAAHAGHGLLEDAEVARQVRAAELVVEGRATERAVDHDLQRRRDVGRLADRVLLPGLAQARQVQVGHREAGQARLGPGAPAGGAFIADLAAGAGGGARVGRDGGGVVVRLHLHQHLGLLGAGHVGRARLRRRHPALDGMAFHHGGVVRVGDDRVLRVQLLGVADHAEQAQRLGLAVHREGRIEDLVPAVLAVGLREHHQLDIAGVAAELLEVGFEVVDLVARQRQAELDIGLLQRGAALAQHVDMGERLRGAFVEQVLGVLAAEADRFGHAVVQQRRAGVELVRRQRLGAAQQATLGGDPVLDDALDALQGQATVARDVGGLGRPGAHGAEAWRDDDQVALRVHAGRFAIAEQGRKTLAGGAVQRRFRPDPVHGSGADARHAGADPLQPDQQGLRAEIGKGVAALEMGQMRDQGHGIRGAGRGSSARFARGDAPGNGRRRRTRILLSPPGAGPLARGNQRPKPPLRGPPGPRRSPPKDGLSPPKLGLPPPWKGRSPRGWKPRSSRGWNSRGWKPSRFWKPRSSRGWKPRGSPRGTKPWPSPRGAKPRS
mmetsp:Transcript_6078/g.24396  ORF Transcript_6078/g.24396 Transcript_6078/m.24396 type:complete len:644 (+) Transcript_6078:1983-3914(+)